MLNRILFSLSALALVSAASIAHAAPTKGMHTYPRCTTKCDPNPSND